MNPPLVLRRSEWLDNWYVLDGGGNWASVEGSSAEWREIAECLRSGRVHGVRHKRAAVAREAGYWDFWSPRNATGFGDHLRIAIKHGEAMADHIDSVLAAYASLDAESVRLDGEK